MRIILQALKDAKLYVNEAKTHLFCYEVDFLGHRISQQGIEVDDKKVLKIIDWPIPKSATEVRCFLSLVRYLSAFLPKLAFQSEVLNELTTKAAEKCFPPWNDRYQLAFQAIKDIVVSRECLTVTARPVAFDSMTFKGAELNYPVHEKELLAIIHAL